MMKNKYNLRRKIMRLLSLFFSLLLIMSLSASAFSQTEALYQRALKYYATGKFTKAADTLKEYVEKKPDPTAYYLLGYSLYKIGKHEEARKYFKQVYLIDPKFDPSRIDFSVIKK